MRTYRFTEHKQGYRKGTSLVSWRPQFATILSWIPRGATIVDAGCGDGVLGTKLISEKQCRVLGFDLDAVGVQEAKRKGIRAILHDANYRFPYKTKQVDIVVCNELLEFVDDPNYVVSEILRVGKAAIIEFPNFGFWVYRLELLMGRFPRLALYGHKVWETRQTKFFTFADFLQFPAMKHVTIARCAGIDWKNRRVSRLATLLPNLFARSVLVEIKQ